MRTVQDRFLAGVGCLLRWFAVLLLAVAGALALGGCAPREALRELDRHQVRAHMQAQGGLRKIRDEQLVPLVIEPIVEMEVAQFTQRKRYAVAVQGQHGGNRGFNGILAEMDKYPQELEALKERCRLLMVRALEPWEEVYVGVEGMAMSYELRAREADTRDRLWRTLVEEELPRILDEVIAAALKEPKLEGVPPPAGNPSPGAGPGPGATPPPGAGGDSPGGGVDVPGGPGAIDRPPGYTGFRE